MVDGSGDHMQPRKVGGILCLADSVLRFELDPPAKEKQSYTSDDGGEALLPGGMVGKFPFDHDRGGGGGSVQVVRTEKIVLFEIADVGRTARRRGREGDGTVCDENIQELQ
jgi:hypothetical protein